MALAGSFEEFKQNTVLDLSSIESNRENEPEQGDKVNYVIAFTGSKLWLDLELDREYFLLNSAHTVCTNLCFNKNFYQHINKITQEDQRAEAMGCQYNCLQKMFNTPSLLEESVKGHPRKIRNVQEFIKIQKEVDNLNDQYINKHV